MSTLAKDVSPLTFKTFREVALWVLRQGYRLKMRKDGVIEAWSILGRRIPPENLNALERFYDDLKRRLKKPRGWPRNVELPKWWSDMALGFKITRARASQCPECGFPVAVLVDFHFWNEWRCPQCGVIAEPCLPNVKTVS